LTRCARVSPLSQFDFPRCGLPMRDERVKFSKAFTAGTRLLLIFLPPISFFPFFFSFFFILLATRSPACASRKAYEALGKFLKCYRKYYRDTEDTRVERDARGTFDINVAPCELILKKQFRISLVSALISGNRSPILTSFRDLILD